MKLNKKAGAEESSLNFLIGVIVTVLLFGALFAAGYQYYVKQTKVQESFNVLVGNITDLEDQEQGTMVYYLPDDYKLVAFDYNGETTGDFTKPDYCDYACICLCKARFFKGESKECLEEDTTCGAIINENPQISFIKPESDAAYFEGPSSGVLTIHYKREGNIVYLSEQSSFVAEESQESIDAFKNLFVDLERCSESDKCSCEVDFSFLENDLAIEFTSQAKLIDLSSNASTLYTIDEQQFGSKATSTYSSFVIHKDENLYLSASIENLETPKQIDSNLYLEDEIFFFVESSLAENYDTNLSCYEQPAVW
tara:strand:- start:561 stop:1490 length:930 start_codon:yes stop_codon:yes gene_type:complete